MDETVSILTVLLGLKLLILYTSAQIHSWVWFSLGGEAIFFLNLIHSRLCFDVHTTRIQNKLHA